jgi:hypothetical protein
VLSSFAVVPELGLRGRYVFVPGFEASILAGLRIVASYAESPTDSGAASPGLGLAVGGGLGWSILDWLSLELQLRYQYSSVSFSGTATRQRFANDPPLVETSVAYEDLKLSLGPVLRL